MQKRRIVWIILLLLFLACIGILALYAWEGTRPWMTANASPVIDQVTGGVASTVYNSAPIQFLIANPVISHAIVLVLGVCPLSFPIIHRIFNRVRAVGVKSAIGESALYPKQSAPTFTSTQLPQPQPESTSKPIIQTQPVPPVDTTPEPATEPAKEG